MNYEEEIKSEEFISKFWEWFDSLSNSEKERFWYYRSDAAKLFYYNKIWVKNENSD